MSELPTASRKTRKVPDLGTLESTLNVYVFSVFSRNTHGHRQYRQRTVLVTPDKKSSVEDQISTLTREIENFENEEEGYFESEVLEVEEFGEQTRQRPPDFATVVVASQLGVVLRSPSTGSIFYDENYQYCPKTSTKLRWVIAREDPAER